MPAWTNHTVYSVPRFPSANWIGVIFGDPMYDEWIVKGEPFTPAEGSLVVVVASTPAPTDVQEGTGGWSLEATVLGDSNLSVWTFAGTQAQWFIYFAPANMPSFLDLYEFEEGTEFLDAAAMVGVANGAPGPALDARTVIHASSVAVTSPDARTATWASGPADTMLSVPQAATPGIAYTTRIGTGAAESVTWTPGSASERLAFAVTTPEPAFPDHTPPERTTTIPLEDRTAVTATDDRILVIEREDRMFSVGY